MIKAQYFQIQEFVPPDVYATRGVKAWSLIDEREIITCDALRKRYGPIYINTWHLVRQPFSQSFQWSGLRTVDYYGDYLDPENPTAEEYLSALAKFERSFSQHKYGRATDKKFMKITAEEVRQDILANPSLFPYINSMELGTSWLHSDCRNCDRIVTYNIPLGR